MSIYQKFTYLVCQTRGHFVTIQCHSLGKKERRAASPSLCAVTASLVSLQLTGVFVAVSRNWDQYFTEKQDCKSMGMQFWEGLSLCNSLLLLRGTVLFPLQQLLSPSLLFHQLSAVSVLWAPCLLGNYMCPGLYSGTETTWKETAPSPSITFLKLPAAGDQTQAAYGERFLVHDGFAAVPRNCWKRAS